MSIRPFSSTAQAIAEVNLTVPTVGANTTVEQAYDPASIAALKPFQPHMTVLVNVTGAVLASGVAFTDGLGVVNAFVKASDGKLYIRYSNSTGGSLGNIVCTHKIMGL